MHVVDNISADREACEGQLLFKCFMVTEICMAYRAVSEIQLFIKGEFYQV